MSETSVQTADIRVLFEEAIAAITAIDEQLDATTDGKTVTRRRVIKELVDTNEDAWKANVEQLISLLNSVEDSDKRYGVFYGFQKALTDAFKKDADEYIEKVVESQPAAEVVTLSDDAKKELADKRKDLLSKASKMKDIGEGFGFPGDWSVPKARRGSIGKRGPRALTLVDWSTDDEGAEFDEDTTVKDVAQYLGYDSPKMFRQALTDADVNPSDPPAEFTFTSTVNGKTVTGTRAAVEVDENGEEDSEEADSED